MTLHDLPALPRDKEGPVFNELGEAQAFALAVRLSEVGCFTWPEWAAILSQEITAAQERGEPDLGNTYYQHWLNALERICVEKHLVGHEDMSRRQQEWQLERRSQHRGGQVDARRVDALPRPERHLGERVLVRAQGELVLGTAVDVVEDDGR